MSVLVLDISDVGSDIGCFFGDVGSDVKLDARSNVGSDV